LVFEARLGGRGRSPGSYGDGPALEQRRWWVFGPS
jgi:hypothetical protein